ncbi:IclR family transcriptional regulator C-terminal domain-containing protein [Streptomyces platensis]|uniref:IclR family transcriptional regulator domain-containing protein n=1 Tax=Streptomyces platensis TaxID=58346 RepID=UPI002E80FEB9|nr:IclR family transcriptional regulator C-terminal domain-containing protein [Streptomyces platensis]WUB84340.1 helix-turn-helix domain-containing protein [Streptomyces platensis]
MPQPSTIHGLVGPLERGLAVLRTLARAPGGRMQAGELARATGLARSPVDRIATTLAHLGYLREEDRELVLAPPLLALGTAYLRSSGVPAALDPIAARLADELDESVSVAVPDGDAVRFVVQHTRRRALTVSFRVGDALPADRCAPGLLFAAEWPDERYAARRPGTPEEFPALPPPRGPRLGDAEFRALAADAAARGWSQDDGLIEPGLVAVAVPVRDPEGRTVCALSAVSHTSRHSVQDLRRHALEPLRRTAARMTDALAALGLPATPPAPMADPTAKAKQDLGPEYLQSLARGLTVLTALGGAPGGMTLSDVAQATGLARATARRSLLALEQLGYAAGDNGLFSPLPRVLDLGYPLLSGLSLGEVAQPHLADLVRQVRESASVAVLDGPDVRYVGRVAASRIMSVTITLGTRFPAHVTSMGRVLLAGLPRTERTRWLASADLRPLTGLTLTDPAALGHVLDQVEQDGYAFVDQELEEGLRSVAVPVHGADGTVVAAVNVSLHAGRTSEAEARDTVLPALRATATRITADWSAMDGARPVTPV